MSDYVLGDVVVLVAGSMRMAVEKVESGMVHVVWSHEGQIGRDAFDPALLRKWEERGGDDRGGRGHGGGRGFGGDRKGGGKPWGDRGGDRGDRGDRGGDRGGWDDKPRGKPGWDGKPRDKGYFRKD